MRIGVDSGHIVQVSDSLIPHLVPPPPASPDVCPNCKTWIAALSQAGGLGDECENCVEVRSALETDPLRCAIVSLYRKPSDLRDWLTRYKGREDEVDTYEPKFVDVVRSLVGRFVVEHGQRFEEACGGFDGIVVVPSTHRPPPHPLESVLESLKLDVPLLSILERADGDLDFRRPAIDGYRATAELERHRVLLVDDVYTTGARLNSAAYALRAAGHQVCGALVVARRVNPEYTEAASTFWASATNTSFTWEADPWLAT